MSDLFPELFDEFWKAYPRKVSKPAARKAFAKLDTDVQKAAIADVEKRTRMRAWSGNKRLIPHAATYLNGERWTDEWEDELRVDSDPQPGLGRYIPPEPKEPEREVSLAERRINTAYRDYLFCSIRYGGIPSELIDKALVEKRELMEKYVPVYREDVEAGVMSKARAFFELVDLFLTRMDILCGRKLKDVVWKHMKANTSKI
jgi:hypothetical protein